MSASIIVIALALGSIVSGIGLQPGATYFILAVALISGIEAVRIPELTLHLFAVFFAVRGDIDEELVYQMTAAFWDTLD